MRKPYRKILLDNRHWDILEKVARESKIDAWFSLRDKTEPDGTRHTVVRDLERNRDVSLQFGVRVLNEGISPDPKADYGLTDDEVSAYRETLGIVGIVKS